MFKQKEADNSSFAVRVGVHVCFYLEYDIAKLHDYKCTYERLQKSGKYRNFTVSLWVPENFNF